MIEFRKGEFFQFDRATSIRSWRDVSRSRSVVPRLGSDIQKGSCSNEPGYKLSYRVLLQTYTKDRMSQDPYTESALGCK